MFTLLPTQLETRKYNSLVLSKVTFYELKAVNDFGK